jgi:hypothetical protein
MISAAFCTKPAPARFRRSRARSTCLVTLCPNPQPHVLTARPILSGWGLCPWESRWGVSRSPSTPPPATGFPLGLGVPQCWGSRPGLRGRSPAVGSSEQLCELGSAAPRGAHTRPSREGCGHRGRLGRPRPRLLRSSRMARRPWSLSTSTGGTLLLHGGGSGKWAVRLGAAWFQPRFPTSEPSAVASFPRLSEVSS